MSRPVSLALVWHASHNGQMGEYHTLPVSLHLLLLLLYSAHPLPCQDVTLLPNGENQSNASSLKAVCIDIASRFFKQRCMYTSACVRIRVEVGEERKKKEGGEERLVTDSSWGRLSPLVTFPVSQQTWQPRRVRGEWRALRTRAGMSTVWQMAPSCSGHHDGTGRGVSRAMDKEELQKGEGRDVFWQYQNPPDILPQSVCQLFLTGFATGLVAAANALHR